MLPLIRSAFPWMMPAVGAATLVLATAAAGRAADARAGEIFAARNCRGCHAIGAAGASPNAAAPPFRTIARRYRLADLEESLAEGIVTGHGAMPEFTLTPRQIDDLLAHMRRLRNAR
jgi:cytochrome c